jgi:hypothetical protein
MLRAVFGTHPEKIADDIAELQGPRPMGDMERRGVRVLEVACRGCERRRRLSIARLIAQHGRKPQGNLRALIAHDRHRMQNPSISIYERCGVHFPELPRWLWPKPRA